MYSTTAQFTRGTQSRAFLGIIGNRERVKKGGIVKKKAEKRR
jgi:hypothetical protein